MSVQMTELVFLTISSAVVQFVCYFEVTPSSIGKVVLPNWQRVAAATCDTHLGEKTFHFFANLKVLYVCNLC